MPVLTVHVAILWAWASWFAATHTATANAARAIGALMTASMMAPRPNPYTSRPAGGLMAGLTQADLAAQQKEREQVGRQIGITEGIIHYWQRTMWVLAGLFDVLVVAGVILGSTRGVHLIITFLMLAGAGATLVAMNLLQSPQWGGMPPLAFMSYLLVGGAMAAYAIVLLIVFWRKPAIQAG